jgi:hypothetical protein
MRNPGRHQPGNLNPRLGDQLPHAAQFLAQEGKLTFRVAWGSQTAEARHLLV